MEPGPIGRIESVTAEDNSRLTPGQRLTLAVAPHVVWALLWVVGFTWRYEMIAEDGATPVLFGQKAGPEIYCVWHQCTLLCTMFYRHSRAVLLISRSFDGELISRILRKFGYDAVRGSSSRSAREGLLGLKGALESGRAAIFTADGPRGPIYRSKMGPVKLAQLTGAPIGAFHLEPERAWVMKSWDRFLVPKPFTRIVVSWAQWTHVPCGLPAEELERKREELNAALERARMQAYAYLKKDLQ